MDSSHVSSVEAVARLNELFALEPDAVAALAEHRVPCGRAFAAHPTLQVRECADGSHVVGLIGVLNAIFGVTTLEDGSLSGFIAGTYDGERLGGFVHMTNADG